MSYAAGARPAGPGRSRSLSVALGLHAWPHLSTLPLFLRREPIEHASERVAPVAARLDDGCADLPLAVLGLREHRQDRLALRVAEVATHHDPQLGAAHADLGRAGLRGAELHLDAVEEVAHRLGRRSIAVLQLLAQGDEVVEVAQLGDAAVHLALARAGRAVLVGDGPGARQLDTDDAPG